MHPTVSISDPAYDMGFAAYNQRQHIECSLEKIVLRAMNVSKAHQFDFFNGNWIPNSYQGFAISTMLQGLPENKMLFQTLAEIRKQLQFAQFPSGLLYYLPEDSYHQTIANCLSAQKYTKNIVDQKLENEYAPIINKAFENMGTRDPGETIKMKMIGLGIFGTAIGLMGAFDNESDYNRILQFRNLFYKQETVEQLGIHMTRPFIGHITLAYIESGMERQTRENMARLLLNINQEIENKPPIFYMQQTGLVTYQHLDAYTKEPHFPIYNL